MVVFTRHTEKRGTEKKRECVPLYVEECVSLSRKAESSTYTHNNVRTCVSHLVTQRFAVYRLRNLEWRLCLQKLNTKYLKRSFSFSRVRLCNKVPQGLKNKNTSSLGQFKRDIKKVCYISHPRRPVMWSKCKGSLSFYLLSSTGDSACETFYLAFHVPSLYRACLHTHYRKQKLDVLIVHLNIYKAWSRRNQNHATKQV